VASRLWILVQIRLSISKHGNGIYSSGQSTQGKWLLTGKEICMLLLFSLEYIKPQITLPCCVLNTDLLMGLIVWRFYLMKPINQRWANISDKGPQTNFLPNRGSNEFWKKLFELTHCVWGQHECDWSIGGELVHWINKGKTCHGKLPSLLISRYSLKYWKDLAAGWNSFAGWIWPAGRSLPTNAINCDCSMHVPKSHLAEWLLYENREQHMPHDDDNL